jgi:Zn-dependent M28 family amino/carboxypeptidase
MSNVVATLPGTQAAARDRIYVVSGHYDSMPSDVMDATSDAPGANDDASGTAAVVEMACVLSSYQFDATLVFMAVAGEEQGLVGSTHWAKAARAQGLDIAGMFTNDIIGSSRGTDGKRNAGRVRLYAEGVPPLKELADDLRTRITTGGENDSSARELARFVKDQAERQVKGMTVELIYRRDRYLRGGDHLPFLEQGYPAVRFVEASEDYRHQHQNVRLENGVQYGDTLEHVDFGYVASVTKVNAAALIALANGPSAPRDAMIETIRLENDTTLRWTANLEPDIAGYRIVWRETTAPYWQQRRDVGNVTRYTLKALSKDDYLFGVVAVDKDGNESVASYPKPYRPTAK